MRLTVRGVSAPREEGSGAGRVVPDLTRLAADAWDRHAGDDNPFTGHAFLASLEASGSAATATGWQPLHLMVDGAGAVPMYAKSHSYGEYVFDHGWADGWMRAGGRYYPKLQVSVPFTPATGPRLLVADAAEPEAARDRLVGAVEARARGLGVSSVHATFLTEPDRAAFARAGWVERHGIQFHWENRRYDSFETFLDSFSSRKRKAVRKERREVAESGVELVTLTGGDLTAEHFDAFFRFYTDTSDRKWGSPYLTRPFFDEVLRRMADRIVLVMARRGREWVAGALNFRGRDALYGRNWGCLDDVKFLHFEACYYRAIDFAIAHGLSRVEAGAQGEHKLSRGYLPVVTVSAHWLGDERFRDAVAEFCARERQAVAARVAAYLEESPFKRADEA